MNPPNHEPVKKLNPDDVEAMRAQEKVLTHCRDMRLPNPEIFTAPCDNGEVYVLVTCDDPKGEYSYRYNGAYVRVNNDGNLHDLIARAAIGSADIIAASLSTKH